MPVLLIGVNKEPVLVELYKCELDKVGLVKLDKLFELVKLLELLNVFDDVTGVNNGFNDGDWFVVAVLNVDGNRLLIAVNGFVIVAVGLAIRKLFVDAAGVWFANALTVGGAAATTVYCGIKLLLATVGSYELLLKNLWSPRKEERNGANVPKLKGLIPPNGPNGAPFKELIKLADL